MKVLIAGWFSFKLMGATAGDLICKDILCGWLQNQNIPFDVALAEPFKDGVNWEQTNPKNYSHVIFTCGPFGNGEPVVEFLNHFKGVKLIGINLSMLQSLDEWNPFDLLIERDSSRTTNPDLTFLSSQKKVPIVGLILVEPQNEYGKRARHKEANEAIRNLLDKQHCVVVPIDTRLDIPNKSGLRTPSEIESLIGRMDLVVTTRLHGMVLALKSGVPVLAIDAIQGGAKIQKQAREVGWENVVLVDDLNEKRLSDVFHYCLTPESNERALQCKEKAARKLNSYQEVLINYLKDKINR